MVGCLPDLPEGGWVGLEGADGRKKGSQVGRAALSDVCQFTSGYKNK